MTDNNPQYDLVVLGATGFVGQIVCQHLLAHNLSHEPLKWAIAGRSRDKLAKLAENLGPNAVQLPQIVADATDASSLRKMCSQTRVVISTVGPYALYGNFLVEVCAELGTDYCDLTGEFQWIRRMIERHDASAKTSGARIVHCCGFDSVPSDMGVYYLQQQAKQKFGQFCERVKLRMVDAQGGVSGGTAASGVNIVKEAVEDPEIRRELDNPYSLCLPEPPTDYHPPTLIPVQYDDDFQQWVTPFIMAAVNTRIVLRSNVLQQYAYGQTFQYEEGILTGDGPIGWSVAQGLKTGLDILGFAVALPPTRWLLENSVIPAAGSGPSEESQQNGFYKLSLVGETAKGERIAVEVTGDRDPGYGSTSKILAQASICLAKDLPRNTEGGFWTPASLLGNALLKRLENYAGLAFKVTR